MPSPRLQRVDTPLHAIKSTLKCLLIASTKFSGVFFGGGGGGACIWLVITPRAHARARGYVIGRGVYVYNYCILSGLFLEPISYLQKYSL